MEGLHIIIAVLNRYTIAEPDGLCLVLEKPLRSLAIDKEPLVLRGIRLRRERSKLVWAVEDHDRTILHQRKAESIEKLEKKVFFMSYSPLPIIGLDSSPVRAYAIEGLKEFS